MADVIAQGPERRDRWRRRLAPNGQTFLLGRECGVWSVPWDAWISREHAQLVWDGHRLGVERLESAANPIFFRGEQSDRFQLEVGDHFVIGRTRLSLVDDQANISLHVPIPISQQTFSSDALRRASFRHVQQQVQTLTRLPEIIAAAETDQELYVSLVNLILTGILSADAAAVVFCPPGEVPGEGTQILHWDRVEGSDGEFQPSGPLIAAAVQTRQSVLHNWQRGAGQQSATGPALGEPFDWAFCTMIPGVACRGKLIYVAGRDLADGASVDLQDALKFVELVGTTTGHICDLRQLQRRTAVLAQFFSPPVRDVVSTADPDIVLAPRRTEVSVLFCDLRGFSRHAEQSADDLFGLLQRVSEALGIMTRRILDYGGVVGDFHGDSAMGFWGWPLVGTQRDADRIERACRAALSICVAFQQASSRDRHRLAGFRVGIGVATGEAVAGKLGTADQVKVTVFGPVVNRASRLEGLTRTLGVSMLVDRVTADLARQQLTPAEAEVRLVARLQPYGMSGVEDVFELVPADQVASRAWEHELLILSEALGAFWQGDWRVAENWFQQLPTADPLRHFYLHFLRDHAHAPPADWDGVIRFKDKP